MIKLYEPKLYKEDIELVNKTLNEGWISGNSPIVEKFENKLKNFCQTKYCTVTSSGTTALHLSLLSSGIKKGDEVIIPSLTYIATANAVHYIGAKPVFCDVNLDDFQIDASKIEKNITKKTKAILPVHLYGGVPELNQIKNIANKHNLKVIHDAAEALGSEFNKKHSVSYKDDLNMIIENDPLYEKAWISSAKYYLRKNDHDKAIENLNKALNIISNNY